ncbi:hypothetical protein ACLMJK_005912 [Lecanora helva]
MSRINIPIEALTSRLNLGSKFEGVRSQSIGTRFANLRPVSEFLDLKRLSKPANFGEVQSRVNYNLSYFSSNYFAVALMLLVYSLLTNLYLLFDMVFMGVGLFGIKKLDGRDLELGFTRATTSQLFVVGRSYRRDCSRARVVYGQANRYSFFRGGGLGGRPRTPKDSPLWGRPSGARLGRKRNGNGRHTQWADDRRFEELDSDEDDAQGVVLDGTFVSDKLHFTGQDLGRRRTTYEYLGSSEDSEDHDSEDFDGGDMQLALRDKEEMLVQKALERIRRAQQLGKKNVKLTQSELEALERKQKKDQARNDQAHRRSTGSNSKGDDRHRKSDQSGNAVRERKPIKRKSKGYFLAYDNESSSSSKKTTPPGTGVVGFSPLGQYTSTQDKLSPSGSRSASSRNLAQPSPPIARASKKRVSSGQDPPSLPPPRSPNLSRTLPDDADWVPRPRSASSASAQSNVYDPYQYQTYAPPQSQAQPHYSPYRPGRRIVSSPQPESRYPRVGSEAQPHLGDPTQLRWSRSSHGTPDESDSAGRSLSDDDEDDRVQVDVVPYGQGYSINPRYDNVSRHRPRRGGR